jgi:hypothetical protein
MLDLHYWLVIGEALNPMGLPLPLQQGWKRQAHHTALDLEVQYLEG